MQTGAQPSIQVDEVNRMSKLSRSAVGSPGTCLPTMIPAPVQFTVQVIWLLQTPLACDSAGLIASPGLVVDY